MLHLVKSIDSTVFALVFISYLAIYQQLIYYINYIANSTNLLLYDSSYFHFCQLLIKLPFL